MKDHLKNILLNNDTGQRLNIAREYLQSYILLLLQKNNFFTIASFVGGTSLRFIYNLPRFSEDLDFSLKIKQKEFKFIPLIEYLKKELENAGYDISVSYKNNTNVYVVMFKFENILYDFGLSPNANQKLSIKMDIDTFPPVGFTESITLVSKYVPLTLAHYDMPSIFAGKMNAMFTRQFIKGRDYYDIFWMLSFYKGISPNIDFLNNSLKQFKLDLEINIDNWKDKLLEIIEGTNMDYVIKDVSVFIEDSLLLTSFNKQGFRLLLSNK